MQQAKQKKAFADRIDEMPVMQAVRRGLVMMIPVLLIGSFSLVLKFLPIPAYQQFLSSFLYGYLPVLFTWVNQATFGLLSLYMTMSISLSYARVKTSQPAYLFGAVAASVASYMVFNGLLNDTLTIGMMNTQGMFTAIFSALFGSSIFCKFAIAPKLSRRFYTIGADAEFNISISIIMPLLITILAAVTLNQLVMALFNVNGFNALFHAAANALFGLIKSPLLQTLLFIVLSSIFWFFGLHGTNVLETVSQNLFDANLIANNEAVAAGLPATEIFTKTFLDTFIVIGGCGATLSLLIAILLFSKQKNNRNLGKLSAFPMLFNINETMVFGLPIVYNTSLLPAFILAPVMNFFVSYFAIVSGIVPIAAYQVEWVTPIGIGGYVATGSFAGVILQLFNVAMGVVIYRYFLLRYEQKTNRRMQHDLEALVEVVRDSERMAAPVALLELQGREGAVAKMLAEDLRYVLREPKSFKLFYQPQYDDKDRCIGAEALLRWDHPSCGIIYPPLLVGLAQETGLLSEMERVIFKKASEDIAQMAAAGMLPEKISVNVTAPTLQEKSFVSFLEELIQENPYLKGVICVELTEQMSFYLSDTAEGQLKTIHDMGVSFAIDDFSMGHTSLQYLQSDQFDIVKLDGSLTKDVLINPRNHNIIASIVQMAKTMNFKVIAEYVETMQQREQLKALGCYLYQGYLYSPAVPLEKVLTIFARDVESPRGRDARDHDLNAAEG
ncbi:EAL domain-containing protein [Christensenellaceae bacterium OttesenSCG-928-M15]|nr:EAL domain-containing protein [Christensenellaceae bacterium OttesenSCG-928-M15]